MKLVTCPKPYNSFTSQSFASLELLWDTWGVCRVLYQSLMDDFMYFSRRGSKKERVIFGGERDICLDFERKGVFYFQSATTLLLLEVL